MGYQPQPTKSEPLPPRISTISFCCGSVQIDRCAKCRTDFYEESETRRREFGEVTRKQIEASAWIAGFFVGAITGAGALLVIAAIVAQLR